MRSLAYARNLGRYLDITVSMLIAGYILEKYVSMVMLVRSTISKYGIFFVTDRKVLSTCRIRLHVA